MFWIKLLSGSIILTTLLTVSKGCADNKRIPNEVFAISEEPYLDWCSQPVSPKPHSGGRLRIATWNLENLHAEDGESTFTGSRPSVTRNASDYERIQCYIQFVDPDVLAVQEVDGEEALRRVVDSNIYDVHVSQRQSGTLNGRQNTGFAFKRSLEVEIQPDFKELDTSGRLRFGSRISLSHQGRTIQMMSVHLKSGCFDESFDNSACKHLADQVKVLEDWIDKAASGPDPFIILGDFNRRFNIPGDTMWSELDDGDPPNADLECITAGMPINCRDNRYTEFIDHILLDRRAAAWIERTSFRHVTFRQQDRNVWDKISTHCPVVVDLWIE